MQLHNKILTGLIAGAVVGIGSNFISAQTGSTVWVDTVQKLEPIGTAFIRLITMIVIPLVVASLLIGAASLGDLTALGRIGSKTIIYYLSTTAIAVTIGLVLSNLIRPGSGISEQTKAELLAEFGGDAAGSLDLAQEAPGFVNTLLSMIPSNPIAAAANGDMLPIIVFTLLFGAAAATVSEPRKKSIIGFFEGVNEISTTIIRWIMKLAPYAVFALIAAIIARFGADILKSLLVYSLTVVLGLALHAMGTYGLIIRFLVRLNVFHFSTTLGKRNSLRFRPRAPTPRCPSQSVLPERR